MRHSLATYLLAITVTAASAHAGISGYTINFSGQFGMHGFAAPPVVHSIQ
jgi:hypothetical protein